MFRRTLRSVCASTLIAGLLVGYVGPVFATTEIDSARTYSSKTFGLPNGEQKTEFHGKWLHYLDANGNWQDIHTSLRDNGDSYVMDKAPFTFTAPKTSAGTAVFTSTNRYDIFKKEIITDKPFSQTIQALGVTDVPGMVVTFKPEWLGQDRDITKTGNTVNDAVVYRNAYAQLNGDLIYWVNYAAAPRLDKLVRIPAKPNTTQDIQIPFKLGFSNGALLKTLPDITKLNLEDQTILNDALKKLKETPEYIDQLNIILATNDSLRKAWNEQIAPLLSQGNIAITPVDGKLGSKRGIGLRDFFVWDSGKDQNAHKEKITVKFELQPDGSLTMTKVIPQTFLATATYPIFTDASATFYPDPDAETTSVDGYILRTGAGMSWSDARDGDGTSVNDTTDFGAAVYILHDGNPSGYTSLSRAFFLFDSSALEDDVTISAADLSLYGDSYGSANANFLGINVSSADPTSNTGLVAADYNLSHYGSTKFMDADVDVNSLSSSGYKTFTLNSSGLSNISLVGVSKFALRAGGDIINSEDSLSAGDWFAWSIYYAENSGTGSDPKLVVTYSAPTPPATPEFSDMVYLSSIIVCGWFVVRFVLDQKKSLGGTGGMGAA